MIKHEFDSLGRFTLTDYPGLRLKWTFGLAVTGLLGVVWYSGLWILAGVGLLVIPLVLMLTMPIRKCVFYLNSRVVKYSEQRLFGRRTRNIPFDNIKRIRIDGGAKHYGQTANIVLDVEEESIPLTCSDDQLFTVEEVLATIKSIVGSDRLSW